MGMVFEAVAVTPEQAEVARTDDEVVERLLFGDESDPGLDDPLGGVPPYSPEWEEEMVRRGRVDLDKSWHGVHFLLTGSAWGCVPPLGLAVLGGCPVGEDGGYGPPRLLTPAEVRAVAGALSSLDPAEVRARFDPAEFAREDIYPSGIWSEEAVLDEYLMPYLALLTRFYTCAADGGRAVLAVIA